MEVGILIDDRRFSGSVSSFHSWLRKLTRTSAISIISACVPTYDAHSSLARRYDCYSIGTVVSARSGLVFDQNFLFVITSSIGRRIFAINTRWWRRPVFTKECKRSAKECSNYKRRIRGKMFRKKYRRKWKIASTLMQRERKISKKVREGAWKNFAIKKKLAKLWANLMFDEKIIQEKNR